MFVEFARNILCRQKTTTYNNQYSDIADTDWTLQPYIIEAYEFGIMRWKDGKFRPTDVITRKEFVASLIRMFVNRYLEEPNKDWFENYEYVFNSYWLDNILEVNAETDRYDVSKIFYRLYYDKNYRWTEGGYVLWIEERGDISPPIPVLPPIVEIDLNTPLVPTVIIPEIPNSEVPLIIIAWEANRWTQIDSAIEQTNGMKEWQTAEVIIKENSKLQTERICYRLPESVRIELWEEEVDKDLVMYQWLLKSYGLTKFTDTDSYKPENWLKRYEAAKMFVEFARNVLCREKNIIYNNQYTDINNIDPTLKPYIIEAYEYGIMKWSKWEFRPTDTISNKEFVTILIRMFMNQNLDILWQWNDWDVVYKQIYQSYGLDSIIWFNDTVDRYGMSKILFKIYFEPEFERTAGWYVLPKK